MSDSSNVKNSTTAPPEPYGPIPSSRQLGWHALEYYGFIHFTVNTFTNLEWGYGDESPDVFAPSDFDASQIARAAYDGGMAGLVLTCKHHDGFCLWPSSYTDHSVKSSSWMNGTGDVVRAVSDACRSIGLKFGAYLSPWDRNHAGYATPEYIVYYRNQLRELLEAYGPFFAIWFDGANGGDGYYGGARETRSIDPRTYYEWEKTWEMVRSLQPDACLFSDGGPDIRWVGNERGIAGETCWHTIDGSRSAPGDADRDMLNSGERTGSDWMPAECDVSIRPGWFYHAEEDDKVRSPENLMDLYYQSVGRGASLHLNLPPDTRGRIHERDVESLLGFRQRRDRIFTTNFITGASVSASDTLGAFSPTHCTDGRRDTYWSANKAVDPFLEIDLREEATFNLVELREFLPLGQRVDSFEVGTFENGEWKAFTKGTSIGNRRLATGPRRTARRLRIKFSGPVPPAVSNVGLYLDSEL